MEHLYVKFGDPSCIDYCDIVRKKTDTQTNSGENLTPLLPSAWLNTNMRNMVGTVVVLRYSFALNLESFVHIDRCVRPFSVVRACSVSSEHQWTQNVNA